MPINHTFIIPGQPVAKGRPRFSKQGHAFTPEKTRRWEDYAALLMRSEAGMPQYDEPLEMQMVAVFERPQRLCRKKDSLFRIPHTAKPDMDNLEKAGGDALVKSGVIKDDSCIYHVLATKWYAAKGEAPHVKLTILSGLP